MGCGSSSSFSEKNKYPNKILNKNSSKKSIQERKSCKTVSYKNITILDNVQKYLPVNTTRNEIKDLVYNALEIKDAKTKSTGQLNGEEIEGIIDMLTATASSEDNKNINDRRLDNVRATIGFYDINKDNIKKLFFKGKKPKEEEVEDKLNDLISINEDSNLLFGIELND